jgi:hypothetical protein
MGGGGVNIWLRNNNVADGVTFLRYRENKSRGFLLLFFDVVLLFVLFEVEKVYNLK